MSNFPHGYGHIGMDSVNRKQKWEQMFCTVVTNLWKSLLCSPFSPPLRSSRSRPQSHPACHRTHLSPGARCTWSPVSWPIQTAGPCSNLPSESLWTWCMDLAEGWGTEERFWLLNRHQILFIQQQMGWNGVENACSQYSIEWQRHAPFNYLYCSDCQVWSHC